MGRTTRRYSGGCLCGALRWEAEGEPDYAGYCCCGDCRKASGSGFMPFMSFKAGVLRFNGRSSVSICTSARGTEAVRNSCPECHSLVFGGRLGHTGEHTLYAGSLDDPSLFRPTLAIFTRDRPDWVLLPPGLQCYEGLP